jgi:hypothetical protein
VKKSVLAIPVAGGAKNGAMLLVRSGPKRVVNGATSGAKSGAMREARHVASVTIHTVNDLNRVANTIIHVKNIAESGARSGLNRTVIAANHEVSGAGIAASRMAKSGAKSERNRTAHDPSHTANGQSRARRGDNPSGSGARSGTTSAVGHTAIRASVMGCGLRVEAALLTGVALRVEAVLSAGSVPKAGRVRAGMTGGRVVVPVEKPCGWYDGKTRQARYGVV